MSSTRFAKPAEPTRIPPVNALPAGARLQEFEVQSVIGEGGFGIVYRAFDTLLEREVAIKEYLPVSHASRRRDGTVVASAERQREAFEKGLRCFVSEARMLARFKHRALVEILRFWEERGTAYMVMPCYEGRPLSQLVQEGFRVQSTEAMLSFLTPLLDGLAMLHAVDCYHRDISTDNILILEDGSPLLLDFGAARRILVDESEVLTIILKPGFAPIEQYSDDHELAPQGAWTDLYALAAVAYLLVTGAMPMVSVGRIIRDPLVPLATCAPAGLSRGLVAAIDAGLRVTPDQRPQSVAAFMAIMASEVALDARREAAQSAPSDDPLAMFGAEDAVELPMPETVPEVDDGQVEQPRSHYFSGRPTLGVERGDGAAASMLAGDRSAASSLRGLAALAGGLLVLVGLGLYGLNGDETDADVQAGVITLAEPETAIVAVARSATAEISSNRQDGTPIEPPNGLTTFPALAPQEAAQDPAPIAGPVATEVASGSDGERADEMAEAVMPADAAPAGAFAAVPAEGAPATQKESAPETIRQGVIDIRVEPWGNVFANGRLVGVAPPRVRFEADPGRIEVEIRNETHAPRHITIEVEAGRTYRIKHEFGKE